MSGGGHRLGIPLAVAAALLLGGCAPSPTSSTVDEHGRTVTVNWRDYPASAWIDADEVLAGPTVEQTPQRSERLLAEAREALRAEFGATRWEARGEAHDDDAWFPMGGNGYGGESMLLTFNSRTWEAGVSVPPREWERVVDTVERVAARYGLEQRSEEELYDGGGAWMRAESLSRGDAEWLSVTVQDAARDEEALREAREHDWLVRGISLFHGVTTIRNEDRDRFERRAAPFRGLEPPAETHSD